MRKAVIVIVAVLSFVACAPTAHATLPEPLEIAYGAHALQRLDVYPPGTAPAISCVLLIHGGGWMRGDKRQFTAPLRQFAELFHAAGWAVVSMNYRLVPETLFPAPVDDVEAVVDWLDAHCPVPGIVVVGESAGGNIAGVAIARRPGLVRAFIALGAVYSLPELPLGAVRDLAAQYVGCDLATCALARDASPASAWPDAVPALLVHGQLDEMVPWDQAADVAADHKSAELWLVADGLHTGPSLLSPELDVAVLSLARAGVCTSAH